MESNTYTRMKEMRELLSKAEGIKNLARNILSLFFMKSYEGELTVLPQYQTGAISIIYKDVNDVKQALILSEKAFVDNDKNELNNAFSNHMDELNRQNEERLDIIRERLKDYGIQPFR